jgi:hypothetical protein
VGFTAGSRGKVPGKTCEKRIKNNNNNNNIKAELNPRSRDTLQKLIVAQPVTNISAVSESEGSTPC